MRRVVRSLLPFALVLIAASPARGLADPAVSRLPRDASPEHLAPSADGSLWTTIKYGGVAQVSPSGRVKEFLNRSHFVSDLAAAPDGSVWVSEDRWIDRIDAAGAIRRWQIGGTRLGGAITSAGGAVWIAENDRRPAIERLSADGARHVFSVPSAWPWLNALAGAADGSVWFTAGDASDAWVGRLTAAGQFARWRVPRSLGAPGRIAAGPDGAMWFAGRHAIGRISADGQVTRFPLSGGLAPHDLVARNDGVWFTSDICLARIDGAGAVTSWPVPGAVQLEGIAAAPGDGFWLADDAGNAVRRFTPAAVAPAACGAPTVTRARGSTAATVSFERIDRFDAVDFFTDMRVQIARRGTVVYDAPVPGRHGFGAFSNSRALSVRDLDGDGEPEAMLLVNWNGAHCCAWSRIFRYDPARKTYVARTHFWGDGGAEPVLRDLDGDRRPEFLSLDDRFEGLNSFAVAARPIQIWSYRRGGFRDVTRRYPTLVRRDAAKLWRDYLKFRKTNARGILPAWAADEYLLGHAAAADRVLRQAAARGELKGSFPTDPEAFIKAVDALLRSAGYRRT
jgi:streptogramin lyase